MRKKAVSPAARRAFAHEVVDRDLCSQRQACRFLKLARSTFNYRGRPPTPAKEQLRRRLLELSAGHPRYGYRRIAALLRREGWRVGKRHIQRLRRDAGLRVPPTRRKIVRRGLSTGLPTTATHRNHVWTWDFIADATVRGGALKLLTILDEYTQRWLKDNRIKTLYIEPGSPWQNGFVESFHGRFRDECLNREQLWTLTEARVVVGDFRQKYNEIRPHSKLGYESLAEFAARGYPFPAPVGLRPPSAGNGQRTNENLNSNQCSD
jgi:transposase InsO family protein